MEQTREEVKTKYEANAQTLIDKVEAELRAVGVEVKRSFETTPMQRKDATLSRQTPSIYIKTDQVYKGMGRRIYQTPSEEVLLIVQIGGSKARYPKRADGAYNIAKIVKNIKEAVEYSQGHEKRMAEYREREAEHLKIQAEETAGIEFPKGAQASRERLTGTYEMRFKGSFENINAKDLGALAADLKALTAKYAFRGIDW